MGDATRRDRIWRLDGVRLGDRLAVDALAIRPGVTAVLGPSGAGKTSLLDVLVGFCRVDAGAVVHETRGDPPLFWAPADGGLWPDVDVRGHLVAVAPRARSSAIDAWLDRFDLTARAAAHPAALSAGERDRLAVARALASGADSLVLDEPFAHVERARVARDWAVVRAHRPAGALVFATHDPALVLAEADRVVCLEAGRVAYDGDVDTLYRDPPTEALASALGAGNWFDARDAAAWLGVAGSDRDDGAIFLRPESIAIELAADGPCRVDAVRFDGAVEAVTLRRLDGDASRVVVRRPHATRLAVGARVMLRTLVLAVALVVATLAGCGRGDATVATDVRVHRLPADGATLPSPRSVAFAPDGASCALDTVGRVLCYSPAGALTTWWRMPATDAGRPEGVVAVQGGGWAVCDTHYHRVLVFDASGAIVRSFGRLGDEPGAFRYPVGIATDARGHLFVCEYGGNDRVQEFTADGRFVRAFGAFGTGPDGLQRPSDLAVVGDRIYVADAINNRVQAYTTDGRWLGVLGGDAPPALDLPYGIDADRDGALWVVEYGAGRLTRLDRDGRVLARVRVGVGPDRGLRTPWGIAVGADGRILVADTGNRRLVEVRR